MRICAGQLTKQEALDRSINEYKSMYGETSRHFNTVIDVRDLTLSSAGADIDGSLIVCARTASEWGN